MDMRRCLEAPRTWPSRLSWVRFEDEKSVDIGPQAAFDLLARRMLRGDYYPQNVIAFDGDFRSEGRDLRQGDRVLQTASLPPLLLDLRIRSMVEIVAAERGLGFCRIGYVTTRCHFAQGEWSAELRVSGDRLVLTVRSTAQPGSLLYWLALPVARWLQIRSREKAIEDLRREALEC